MWTRAAQHWVLLPGAALRLLLRAQLAPDGRLSAGDPAWGSETVLVEGWLLAWPLAPRSTQACSAHPPPYLPLPHLLPYLCQAALWPLAGPEGRSGAGPRERTLLVAVPCRVREKNLLFLFISAKARQRGLPK